MPYKDKKKRQEYHRNWQRTNPKAIARTRQRKAEIQEIVKLHKMWRPCLDCGKTYPPECMDFDHIRGKKLGSVGTMAGNAHPWKRILEEISKCDLVCANCHRSRTLRRKQCKISVEAWTSGEAEEIHLFQEHDQRGAAYVFGFSPKVISEAQVRAFLLENGINWHPMERK